MHVDLRGQRIDLVIDRVHLLVFGGDELHRLLGDVRIGGDDGGDRLADEAHLLVGQDRLVVERRAVIGAFQHLHHVVDGDDVQHARQLLGRAGVDRLDLAVRDGAAEQLGVHHARHAHGVGVFGAAGDLVAAFEARHRAADLRADLGAAGIEGRDHQCAPSFHPAPRAMRAPDIDLHQFALVGHRAAHVGDELAFADRGLAGLREQLVVDGLAVDARPRRT